LIPQLRKKFGNVVTYEDNPKAHIRTEFGFDVNPGSEEPHTSDRLSPDFIGFRISKPVLERAFQDTYGIPLTDVLTRKIGHRHLPPGRSATILPEMDARGAHRAPPRRSFRKLPNFKARQFPLLLSRTSYQKEWVGLSQAGLSGPDCWRFFLKICSQDWPQGARLQDPTQEKLKTSTSPA